MAKNFRNRSANVHQFAMVPRADIPRASFTMESAYKTTFGAAYLIPVYVEEVLPGDTFNMHMTAYVRLSTPIVPVMDNLYLDTFFFFVPNRLVWDNWQKFMGERSPNPGSSISYTVPTISALPLGFIPFSMFDYMGLPTGSANSPTPSALPMRGYNLIWNEWFRDQNLQNSATVNTGDGPDGPGDYPMQYRGKRHDYFTSALPFVQKGTAVSLPLGTSAPVTISQTGDGIPSFGNQSNTFFYGAITTVAGGTSTLNSEFDDNLGSKLVWSNPKLAGVADLSTATAATINQLRQAFQIQKLLERDARGGTRYTELLRAHFGVTSPDARLQRPEYLGGGTTMVNISPIAQTSGTGGSGTNTPLANLGAIGTAVSRTGFRQSFVEHGYVIGLCSVRADLTYQQGMRRHWSRQTRYDFYWPAFAMLGEQAILNKEIYWDSAGTPNAVFGYQERWAEYRYTPSQITAAFRSNYATTLDVWHLAQNFASQPVLNDSFIRENAPVNRVLAVTGSNTQFLMDALFVNKVARPLPLYSVPGLVDHF